MSRTARARMIERAAVSMRSRGVEATSFAQILVDSNAPRGSLYHYFPRGRVQMLEEAVAFADDYVAEQFRSCFAHGLPSEGVRAFADIYLKLLRKTDFADGCPILVAGLEGERSPSVRSAAGSAFQTWEAIVAESLTRHGIPDERSQRLASVIVAGLEGGIALSRAQQSLQPLESVAIELGALLDTINEAPATN